MTDISQMDLQELNHFDMQMEAYNIFLQTQDENEKIAIFQLFTFSEPGKIFWGKIEKEVFKRRLPEGVSDVILREHHALRNFWLEVEEIIKEGQILFVQQGVNYGITSPTN